MIVGGLRERTLNFMKYQDSRIWGRYAGNAVLPRPERSVGSYVSTSVCQRIKGVGSGKEDVGGSYAPCALRHEPVTHNSNPQPKTHTLLIATCEQRTAPVHNLPHSRQWPCAASAPSRTSPLFQSFRMNASRNSDSSLLCRSHDVTQKPKSPAAAAAPA